MKELLKEWSMSYPLSIKWAMQDILSLFGILFPLREVEKFQLDQGEVLLQEVWLPMLWRLHN